jgi:hypothetical protein
MECLNVLPKSVDEFECAESMTQLFDLIQMCWDSNPRIATEQCLRVLRQLGTKLYDNRSPFYNILRKYYGLYGHPLELVLFDTPPPVVATTTTTGTASLQLPLSTPNQSSTTAPTPSTPTGPPEKLTRSSSDLRVRLALINPESKDALEEQFLGASLGAQNYFKIHTLIFPNATYFMSIHTLNRVCCCTSSTHHATRADQCQRRILWKLRKGSNEAIQCLYEDSAAVSSYLQEAP